MGKNQECKVQDGFPAALWSMQSSNTRRDGMPFELTTPISESTMKATAQQHSSTAAPAPRQLPAQASSEDARLRPAEHRSWSQAFLQKCYRVLRVHAEPSLVHSRCAHAIGHDPAPSRHAPTHS